MNDERWNRLASAILLQAVRDFRTSVKDLRNAKRKDVATREMKLIIDFIFSDWFMYLTNGNSPQIDCANTLIKQIKDEEKAKELRGYVAKKFEHYKKFTAFKR